MSLFNRLSVMNGWSLAPHCWWRFLLLPFGWEVCRPLGWTSVSLFGFTFFWKHRLSAEHERRVLALSKKLMEWMKKNGRQI